MPEIPAAPDPSDLTSQVAEAFADRGSLANAMPAFEPRESQRKMAAAAAEIFERGGVLLAEAGTGTGKTLAYLVPAILSRHRVLVSTGTKNLQDQIYYKDLLALQSALGVPLKVAYMKGRSNYLCRHRFDSLRQSDEPRHATDRAYLTQLAEWVAQTKTGDRAEIEDLPDNLGIWNDIAATSETCIGTECPQYQDCFVTQMRQRAAESDLVIVNHHLLWADAAVRQSAYGEVIPACTYAVIDEAHQLEDVATQYFGILVNDHRLEQLCWDARRALTVNVEVNKATGPELRRLLDRVQDCARFFFGSIVLAGNGATERTRITPERLAPMAGPGQQLLRSLDELEVALSQLYATSESLTALARRTGEIRDDLRFLLSATDRDFVYFLELRGRGVSLRAAPIDVSTIVRELLLDRMQGTIFTSATLTVDESFNYVRGRLGIVGAHELRLPGEFDYREQAIFYLPRRMPDPRKPRFPEAVAREVAALLHVTSGRAFVLFTSYANLHAVQALLRPLVPFPLLVQGTSPRTVLLREFRATPNAVLLATSSFWQGIDVAGEALSCVVIDKLPFASPGEPLTAARMEAISDDGGNPFTDYQVPLAILTLLQGLGRLIRHRQDRGVLALLDPRIHTTGYGKRFLVSLPPAPVTHDLAEVNRFFKGVDLGR